MDTGALQSFQTNLPGIEPKLKHQQAENLVKSEQSPQIIADSEIASEAFLTGSIENAQALLEATKEKTEFNPDTIDFIPQESENGERIAHTQVYQTKMTGEIPSSKGTKEFNPDILDFPVGISDSDAQLPTIQKPSLVSQPTSQRPIIGVPIKDTKISETDQLTNVKKPPMQFEPQEHIHTDKNKSDIFIAEHAYAIPQQKKTAPPEMSPKIPEEASPTKDLSPATRQSPEQTQLDISKYIVSPDQATPKQISEPLQKLALEIIKESKITLKQAQILSKLSDADRDLVLNQLQQTLEPTVFKKLTSQIKQINPDDRPSTNQSNLVNVLKSKLDEDQPDQKRPAHNESGVDSHPGLDLKNQNPSGQLDLYAINAADVKTDKSTLKTGMETFAYHTPHNLELSPEELDKLQEMNMPLVSSSAEKPSKSVRLTADLINHSTEIEFNAPAKPNAESTLISTKTSGMQVSSPSDKTPKSTDTKLKDQQTTVSKEPIAEKPESTVLPSSSPVKENKQDTNVSQTPSHKVKKPSKISDTKEAIPVAKDENEKGQSPKKNHPDLPAQAVGPFTSAEKQKTTSKSESNVSASNSAQEKEMRKTRAPKVDDVDKRLERIDSVLKKNPNMPTDDRKKINNLYSEIKEIREKAVKESRDLNEDEEKKVKDRLSSVRSVYENYKNSTSGSANQRSKPAQTTPKEPLQEASTTTATNRDEKDKKAETRQKEQERLDYLRKTTPDRIPKDLNGNTLMTLPEGYLISEDGKVILPQEFSDMTPQAYKESQQMWQSNYDRAKKESETLRFNAQPLTTAREAELKKKIDELDKGLTGTENAYNHAKEKDENRLKDLGFYRRELNELRRKLEKGELKNKDYEEAVKKINEYTTAHPEINKRSAEEDYNNAAAQAMQYTEAIKYAGIVNEVATTAVKAIGNAAGPAGVPVVLAVESVNAYTTALSEGCSHQEAAGRAAAVLAKEGFNVMVDKLAPNLAAQAGEIEKAKDRFYAAREVIKEVGGVAISVGQRALEAKQKGEPFDLAKATEEETRKAAEARAVKEATAGIEDAFGIDEGSKKRIATGLGAELYSKEKTGDSMSSGKKHPSTNAPSP